MNKVPILLLALLVSSAPYAADEPKTETTIKSGLDTRWLRLTEGSPIAVEVHDDVTDGCWTNVQAIQNAVELELQRSGYAVVDEEAANYYVRVKSFGARNGRLCIASYNVSVRVVDMARFYSDGHVVQSPGLSLIWSNSGVLSGPKPLNSGLREAYMSVIQQFLLSIDAQQKEVLSAVKDQAALDVEWAEMFCEMDQEHCERLEAARQASEYWSAFSID